jgi:uncharacterized protein
MSRILRSLLIFSFLFIAQQLFAQLGVPPLEDKRVHDQAGVLSPQTVQNLEYQLKLHEDSTGNQIAILIINSLNGEAVEDYAIRVAHYNPTTKEGWGLGQNKNDNGVLLLIAVDDRKMRIEVGQGLEGALTDALSSQIIRNEMAPNFRRGDYDAGVLLAVNAIIRAIAGEYQNDSESNPRGRRGTNPILIIFIVFAVISVLSRFFKGGGGNSGGRGWSSGSGWFVGGGGFGGGSGGGGGGFSGGGGSFGGGGSSGSW